MDGSKWIKVNQYSKQFTDKLPNQVVSSDPPEVASVEWVANGISAADDTSADLTGGFAGKLAKIIASSFAYRGTG